MAGPVVVVIAMGEMGAGIARRLVLRGCTVRTSLKGRSGASIARAKVAGAQVIDDDASLVEGADLVLSVVPPGQARALAEWLAPGLQAAKHKPAFVDCNAVSPATVKDVASIIAPTGAGFVDGGIVGAPPGDNDAGPRLYISGPAAERAMALKAHGLDMRLMPGDVGAASALKLSYAALSKGAIAIGAAMLLSAQRNGVSDMLMAEIADSQKALLGVLQDRVPDMYHKAYRWVAEMEEIGAYLADIPGGDALYQGAARLYEGLAAAQKQRGTPGNAIDALDKGLASKAP